MDEGKKKDKDDELQLNGDCLPDDIMLNILSRLPVESLSSFRWVCKSWFKTISHSKVFAKMHQTNSESSPSILLCKKLHNWQPFQLQAKPLNLNLHGRTVYESELSFQETEFIGSVNGLLCFSDISNGSSVTERSYHVCNPITNEYVRVAGSHLTDCATVTNDFYGFGYDSITDKFKLIRMTDWLAEVHTLGSGKWRRVDRGTCNPNMFHGGRYVNGFFYWIGGKSLRFFDDLVSFNVSCEEFHTIRLPEMFKGYEFKNLAVFDERLCIGGFQAQGMDIWVSMNGDFEAPNSWRKEYVVPLFALFAECHNIIKLNSDELLLWLCVGRGLPLHYYDPKTKKLALVKIGEETISKDKWVLLDFSGTLISPI